MISRDQARQAAESLLEPSRQDLAKRQQRLARFAQYRESPIYAALFAAISAVLAFDYSGNLVISAVAGTAIGWALGAGLRRPIGKSAADTRK